MRNKGNPHIAKLMWAIMDESVTIMIKTESNICLAKRTWLNRSKTDIEMLPQEIIKDDTDTIEGYLVIWSRGDGGDGQVTVQASSSPCDCTVHWPSTRDHHTVETLRDERGGVNEPHLQARDSLS